MGTKIIGGVVNVKAGDESLVLTDSSATSSPLKFVKEGQASVTHGAAGYTETGRVPSLDLEAFTVSEGSVNTIFAMSGRDEDVVEIQAKNGDVHVYYNAWYAGEGEVDITAGKFPIPIQALDAEIIEAS